MNQFKKAKQIAQESGKKTESITDLKTAGVTGTVPEEPKPETQNLTPASEILSPEIQTIHKDTTNQLEETISPMESPFFPSTLQVEKTEDKTIEPELKEIIPPVSVNPTPQLIAQPQILTAEYTYPSKASSSKSSTGKKNVPNIFAPKGEAKSMRKSLVLKPTSVKIAENYCAKNGGSFNELIQTLLDNFIEEYGL